ncbi:MULTISPECIES: alpha/beta fold hydrolase [Pseudomonas]|uniref:Alpha/beta hydrolase n=1 Tax=Pseudomonas promysalinigenes TaxID=485898 RepID=A0ABY6AQ47_9PSED|nr:MULTISPECIES: alpha/beta hydrolase [Pseudomonas]UXH41307.1 alpha/beta hydrolase [Pseudomonas promysalinigenes]
MDFESLRIKYDGVDGIMIAGDDPKRCVIAFSSMNKGKFERWSWFQEMHDAGSDDLYIILKDDSQHYYLGTDQQPSNIKHYRFFEWILEKYKISPDNTFMLGSSMGGYAALYYGFWIGVRGIVSINPQTTYAACRMHSLQLWERMAREAGTNWVDLDQYLYRFKCKPAVYIEQSDYHADIAASSALIDALVSLKIPHIRVFVGGEHGGTSITKDKLLNFMSLTYSLSPPTQSS